MEISTDAVQRALDAFVAVLVDGGEEFLQQGGARWDVEAPLERDQAIDEGPRSATLVGGDCFLDDNQGGFQLMGLP